MPRPSRASASSLIPLIVVAILLHELGHGVAAKAAGARVDRVGIGWFWFRLMLFVDTSDAWLANREQRMLVDAGGILVNLVLAGAAGYVALLAPNLTVAAVAWMFALWSYVAVLRNLNPLLEYDGYYLLMDALERPNLRGKSLGWIATGFWPALRSGRELARPPVRTVVCARRGRLHRCHYGLVAVHLSLHSNGLGGAGRSAGTAPDLRPRSSRSSSAGSRCSAG